MATERVAGPHDVPPSEAAGDAAARPGMPGQQTRPGGQHRHRTAVARRLARAEGHLAAVRRMVDEGRDCPDILIQLAAVRAALEASARLILADHMESCVRDAARAGDAESAWADLHRALESFIR